MHQVYDDETTFKLVAAASQVSGLPMEVCLEEFGKHFLVYCQKNGYDQILRVLGSNLYDFLTNLDNLHDHLASIYPGMRAPSFRVTRNLESNGGGVGVSGSGIGSSSASSSEGHSEHQQQQQQHGDDGSHMSLAAGSMYLHYYSERNGLSPIVKGLVLAVAREFFSTDIVVTECKLLKPQLGHAHDHVVLKIDRRSQADIQLDERTSQAVSQAAAAQQAAAAAATQQVRADSPSSTGSPQQMKEPQLSPVARSDEQKQTAREQHHQQLQNQHQQQQQQHKTMLSSAYGDTMSKLASDSLINSEIMMQTFPFHVIFDRYFNLVQVGNALLRVTSLYWQRRQQTASRRRHMKKSGDGDDDHLIKFGDLFSIVRPKIEFTFDAIADHTNQVFVVKTRPLVLNADYYRSIAEESGGGGVLGGGCHPSSGSSTNAYRAAGGSDSHQSRPGQSLCPMSRMAMKRRSCAPRLTSGPPSSPPPETSSGAAEAASADVNSVSPDANGCGAQATATKTAKETTTKRPSAGGIAHHNRQQQHGHHHHGVENDSGNELSSFNLLSLRLKGQMIILSGPMGASASGAPINQDQAETASGSGRRSGSERDSAGETTAATETTTAAQAAPEQQGPFCLYLCSPRVDHLDQLMECGVKMSDLALHDRARELMLMSHTHKEDREAVKKLDQATNDLKKMDTKLRQENKRTNEVLHNIFPAKIATLLSHGTKIESESFDPVTCLYSDIIGFTKMCGSENVRPIDIVRLLNTLYLQFDNLTNIHGVYKVETIGDAYVIVGGLPEPLEDHADRCVRMGLDMVKVIATVRSPADNQPIQMRIGIHSGPVMAGIVGIRVPRYSLFGNTTTLANQLETHGVGGKIHISDVTLKNLIKRDRFVIEDNPNQISGFPFKTYFVTNYLGDQTELLKHEKILEEQLIKDFELMGNEVELVDDSSRVVRQHQQQKQHHHHYQQQQHPAPETTAGELTRSLADKSTAATRGASGEADTSTQRLLTEAGSQRTALDQEQASAGSRTTTTATSQQTTRKQHRHHHNRTTPDTTRDSLVLMDVEDNGQSAQTRELLQQQQQPFKELLELSNKLSDDILAEALVEFEDLQTLERLLALLTTSNRSVCSRIVACLGLDLDGHRPTTVGSQQQQQQAEGSKNHQQRGPIKSATSKASGQSGCPFCLDDERRLLAGETDRNRMKLIAIAASIALRLTGEAQFVPALQLVANGASGSSGSASTSGTSGDQRMPSLGERVLEQSTAGLSGGDQDGIVVGTTGDNNVMMPVRSTRPDVRGELLAGTRRTNQQEDGRDNRTIEPMGTSATMTAVAKPNDNQQSVRHGSLDLEQALESLRLEREGLAAQVKQLRQCLDKLGLVSETAVVGQHKQQVGMQQSASGPGGAASLSAASKSSSGAGSGGSGSGGSGSLIGRPLVLSTNMQRMKRMDTLKRRKIKRDQQQQQLQQQQSMASSPRLVSPLSSSSSAIQENSASYRHTPAAPDEQLNMERPPMPPKPPPLTNPGLKQETTQTATGRQAQQSVLAYHQSPTENNNLARTHHSSSRVSCGGGAEEAILESADEADSTIDEEPSAVSAQTAAIYEGQQHQPSKRMIDKDDGGPTRQPIGSRPLDGRGSQGNNARPVVTPSVEKEPSLDDVGQARAAPGQRPKLKQQQSAAATTAYIYQSFRSSLTSLLNETVGQQRSTTTTTTNEQTLPRDKGQPEGRKRFSLNAFGMGLSAAIGSPFSSPTKNYSQGRKQPTGSVDQAQTKIISEQQQAIAMARRNTSGSQSGSSGGGSLGMSHQHQRPSSGRGSSGASTSAKRKSSSNSSSGGNNCSCLKSSSSNHSVESENQMIK